MIPAASVWTNSTRRVVLKSDMARPGTVENQSWAAPPRQYTKKPMSHLMGGRFPKCWQAAGLPRSFADIRQQCHVPGPLDRLGHRVLADRRAAGLAAAHDLAVAVNHLLEQLDVLVIDEHRTRPLAIDEQRVLLLDLDPRLGLAAGFLVFAVEWSKHGRVKACCL